MADGKHEVARSEETGMGFGNHANMTASVNRYHNGTVRTTTNPTEDGNVAELYVYHMDGSHGWEHTVDNGLTWIPRQNPVLRHVFWTENEPVWVIANHNR